MFATSDVPAPVRSAIKRALCYICERSIFTIWLLNLSRFVSRCVKFLRSRYGDGAVNYWTVGEKLGTDAASDSFNDHNLNFFFRVASEGRYAFIIEIGALHAIRSRRLAQLMLRQSPAIKIYALDITRDFVVERELDGVTLGPNTLSMIETIAKRHSGVGEAGMICAHGTLCYYPQSDLAALFNLAFSLGLDIAFSEPNISLIEHSRPRSWRRTRKSHYHPYIPMLLRAGYQLPDGGGQQVRDCWGLYAEERTFIFARPATFEELRVNYF